MTVEHYPYGEESMGLGAEKTAEEESLPMDPRPPPPPKGAAVGTAQKTNKLLKVQK
jgi:hypothetical protein